MYIYYIVSVEMLIFIFYLAFDISLYFILPDYIKLYKQIFIVFFVFYFYFIICILFIFLLLFYIVYVI